jgi:hypothetical protein
MFRASMVWCIRTTPHRAYRRGLAEIVAQQLLVVLLVLYTDDERGPVCYYVMLLGILMVIHERNSF